MSGQPRRPVVLIVSYSNDNGSIQRVMDAVAAQGGLAYRFDSDRFPTDIRLSSRYVGSEERLRLSCEDYELDLSSVSAVWYRRAAIAQRIPETMDPQLRRPAIDESRATVYGLIASLDAFQLDAVHLVRRAENKQLQLKLASQVGLSIPRTLIGNEPEAVRRFARECEQMVMKTLTSFSIYERGEQRVVFTNPIRPEHLEHLDDLRFCPAVFQERLPKALELRATIVGDRVFTASIDSQRSEKAKVDWRRDGIGLIESWQPYALPAEVEQGLLKLVRALGLHYGAADLILTPAGRHVFLEVNPNGEFFWLEKNPGLPICGAIADLLVRSANRRLEGADEATPQGS